VVIKYGPAKELTHHLETGTSPPSRRRWTPAQSRISASRRKIPRSRRSLLTFHLAGPARPRDGTERIGEPAPVPSSQLNSGQPERRAKCPPSISRRSTRHEGSAIHPRARCRGRDQCKQADFRDTGRPGREEQASTGRGAQIHPTASAFNAHNSNAGLTTYISLPDAARVRTGDVVSS
jgi:hypothetical protein